VKDKSTANQPSFVLHRLARFISSMVTSASCDFFCFDFFAIIQGSEGVVNLKEIILMLTELLNNIHDFIQVYASNNLNLGLNDKDLHFWIMGIIGILVFLIVLILSKFISKMPFGITILSFLYTFTFMVVLVFAIEIQQAITNRGNMEFQDAIVGLWGYVVFFLGFAIISSVILIAKRFLNRLLKNGSNKKVDL